MPTKHSSQPRNVTGIYLGLEGNVNPPKQRSGIPPLVRPRGSQSYKVRTPVEERRYAPALYHEKKQMVELMRIKEEKRGFVGQPLKKNEINTNKRPVTTSPSASPRRWGPAKRTNSLRFTDRIRTNPRHFTPILNSGVTRSENLTGFASYSVSNPDVRHIDDITDDFSRLSVVPDNISTVGDQYNRLYEVESDIVYHLLPRRTPPPSRCHGNDSYTTGFSIRSYRNPNQAEILADFPDPKAHLRPKTVPNNQAFVPQPYFFRYYNHHRPVRTISAKSKYSDKDSIYNGSKILAVPGAGSISKSLSQRHNTRQKHNSSPVELDSQQPHTFQRSDESEASVSMPAASASCNPASKLLDSQATSHSKQELQQSFNDPPTFEVTSDMAEVATLNPEETTRKMRPLKTSNSGADITLGLEDADGTTAEVEIDVNDNESEIAPEEIPRGKVRKASIVEKLSKTKASEAYVATVKSSAEQRAKDFEKLLNEHAEIVQEIGRTASAENLTSDERDP